MLKYKFLTSIFMVALVNGACAQQDVTKPMKDVETSQKAPGASDMTPVRMAEIITKFDEDAEVESNRISFKVRDRDMLLVFDASADRMRILSGIYQASAVPEEIHERLLQANFDAVLDSRYAIANDVVWSVFIHRISSLTEQDLKSGIAQTFTAAETFGSTYTSGAIVFGGGDTNSLHEELLEELENAPTKEDQDI